MRPEAQAWWEQANADLAAARDIITLEHWFAAAFFAHQAAEAAMKALFIVVERELPPRTHNLRGLATRVGAPAEVMMAVTRLAPVYTTSRYPDAASGRPIDAFDRTLAQESLDDAEKAVQWVSKQIEQT